jgi:D-alanyl-D-alanine carboxypeptidase
VIASRSMKIIRIGIGIGVGVVIGVVAALAGCPKRAAPPPEQGSTVGSAAPAPVDDLGPELETARAARTLPALTAAVWRDGALVARGAVGLRVATDPASAVGADDRWHLGSNTKAMTATLIGIYVDRGLVKWDATLATVFSDVAVHAGLRSVTIEQLLQHRGGIANDAWRPPLTAALMAGKEPARADLARAMLEAAPGATVGSFEYSNAGFILAGAIVERVGGASWEELIVRELWRPLGMTGCGFGAPTGAQPWGHDDGNAPVEPGPAADNHPILGPAGTAHCTLESYGKFLALHAGTAPPDAAAVISAASLARLHAAPTTTEGTPHAGGWVLVRGGGGIGHAGSNTMWYLTAIVLPDAKLAVVVATNRADATIAVVRDELLARYQR